MNLGLTGQGALVAGGGRGLGRAVAVALTDEGATVVVLGRDGAALDRVKATTSVVRRIVADTTDDPAVHAAVDAAAEQVGRLDVLVNCAAPRSTASAVPGLTGLDDEALLEHVDTQVLGYVRVARAALPHLLPMGGAIVNASGTRARTTGLIIGSVRYLGVVALTKNLADELGPVGTSVVCVHPGHTLTECTRGEHAFAESRPAQLAGATGDGRGGRRPDHLPRLATRASRQRRGHRCRRWRPARHLGVT